MTKICHIVCDHGLGHLRRTIIQGHKEVLEGHQVTILSPMDKFQYLASKSTYTEGIKNIDFRTNTTPKKIMNKNPEEWVKKLPNLTDQDQIYCDNLPEILMVYPNTKLRAQFFWHDVIEECDEKYKNLCDTLLKKHEPVISGCSLFAMKEVKIQKNFRATTLYKNPDLERYYNNHKVKKRDLLITCGSTDAIDEFVIPWLNMIKETKPERYECVNVDERLIPKNSPNWIKKADFSSNMYCRILDAFIRPGLGTITDLLTVDVIPTPLLFESNREMIHNAQVLHALKINEKR